MSIIDFSAYRKKTPATLVERFRDGQGPLFWVACVACAGAFYACLWMVLAIGATFS